MAGLDSGHSWSQVSVIARTSKLLSVIYGQSFQLTELTVHLMMLVICGGSDHRPLDAACGETFKKHVESAVTIYVCLLFPS